jgi:hypothetical protein
LGAAILIQRLLSGRPTYRQRTIVLPDTEPAGELVNAV